MNQAEDQFQDVLETLSAQIHKLLNPDGVNRVGFALVAKVHTNEEVIVKTVGNMPEDVTYETLRNIVSKNFKNRIKRQNKLDLKVIK